MRGGFAGFFGQIEKISLFCPTVDPERLCEHGLQKKTRLTELDPQGGESKGPDHGAKGLVGQNLQKEGMGHSPIDDVHRVDAAFGSV